MKTRQSGSGPPGLTSVEVDAVLLERAKTVLGVRTARRAVELALQEVIRRAWDAGQ